MTKTSSSAKTKPKVSDTVSNAPDASAPRQLEDAVARQIKQLRHQLGLKVCELAERAGISVALLSRIEHGMPPSLHTLEQLANALNVPITQLFAQYSHQPSVTHIPAGKGMEVVRAGSTAGQLYKLLGTPMEGNIQVEPYLITIDEKSKSGAIFQHDGIEFIFMLTGSMIYRHGQHSHSLKKGDSLFFDARIPHGAMEFKTLPCKFLAVISYHRD